MTHKFTITGITPSQNTFDRMHWSKKYALRNEWYSLVLAYAGKNKHPCESPAHLSITRIAKRLIDLPNIAAPCKFLIDAMVEYHWLRGDGPKDVLSFTVAQRKPAKGEEEHMEVFLDYA